MVAQDRLTRTVQDLIFTDTPGMASVSRVVDLIEREASARVAVVERSLAREEGAVRELRAQVDRLTAMWQQSETAANRPAAEPADIGAVAILTNAAGVEVAVPFESREAAREWLRAHDGLAAAWVASVESADEVSW